MAAAAALPRSEGLKAPGAGSAIYCTWSWPWPRCFPGAQVSVLLLLIAVVIDLVKRDDARSTWQESHFSWRLRSVLWGHCALCGDFPVLPAGPLDLQPCLGADLHLDFLYRIVSGMIAMSKNRARSSLNRTPGHPSPRFTAGAFCFAASGCAALQQIRGGRLTRGLGPVQCSRCWISSRTCADSDRAWCFVHGYARCAFLLA